MIRTVAVTPIQLARRDMGQRRIRARLLIGRRVYAPENLEREDGPPIGAGTDVYLFIFKDWPAAER